MHAIWELLHFVSQAALTAGLLFYFITACIRGCWGYKTACSIGEALCVTLRHNAKETSIALAKQQREEWRVCIRTRGMESKA
jgi:hypothetical protein